MFRLLLPQPAPLQKSAGKLNVIAIGPKGGQIVGYLHGDMKKPVYAGSAAAAKLAKLNGHKGADAHGDLGNGEWLDMLQDHYGLLVKTLSGGAAVLTSPTSPHAILLALSAMPGAHTGKIHETPTGWVCAVKYEPEIKDEAAVGGKAVLVHQGGAKPAGWPDNVPPPGTVVKRSLGDHTYLLTISQGSDGKPTYLVTAPPGAPLYVFSSTASSGLVKGTIGHGEMPLTVAFKTHTEAAIAIVGPAIDPDTGVAKIKSTSGASWWGWWAEKGKTAPVPTEAGQAPAPAWLEKIDAVTGWFTPETGLSSPILSKVWPDGKPPTAVDAAAVTPAPPPPPPPPAPPAPESPPAPSSWPAEAAPPGSTHTFELHGHQVHVEVVDAGQGPEYVVTIPTDPSDVGHVYNSLEDLKLHLDAIAGGEPEADGALPTFLTEAQIQAALGGAPAPAEEPLVVPQEPAAPPPEQQLTHPAWAKLPAGVSPGFSSQKTLKPGKAPENKGKTALLVMQAGASGAPEYKVTLPEGGAIYNDPTTGAPLPTPMLLGQGESVTFTSATAAAEALMNAPATGFIFWGLKPGKSGKLEAVVLPPATPAQTAPPPAAAEPPPPPEPVAPEPVPADPPAPEPPAPTPPPTAKPKASKKKPPQQPQAPAEKKPSGWAAWAQQHPGTGAAPADVSAWLDAAPAGSALPIPGGHAWKSVDGKWVDAQGAEVSPPAAATPADAMAAEGVGPDGMKHQAGTKFVWAKAEKVAGAELYNDLLKAFPGALMAENTETAKGVKLPPNVYKLQFPLTLIPSSVNASDKAAVKAYVEGVVLPLLPKYGFKPFTKELCNHVGGSNAFANIQGDASVVVAVQTTVQAIPPAATGTNAHLVHDEAMLSATPWHGHGIDMDSDLIRDQHVSVTRKKGGAREVRFKLTTWGAQAVAPTLSSAPAGVWQLGGGNFDAKAGEVSPIGLVHHTTPARVLSGPGWTAHFADSSDVWAMHHAVKVEVAPGTTVAAAMAELAGKLGQPKLSEPPSDEAREHLKLRKLLWNVDPKGHNDLFGELGSVASPPPDNAALRKMLVKKGLTEQQIDAAEIVSIGSGHRAVRVPDGQTFVDKGIHGLYHNWYSSDAKDLARKLASGGNVATAQRWKTGMGGFGLSSPSDMASGGADYVFHYVFRPDADHAFAGWHAQHGLHIVTGVETLERADWHSATNDNYGNSGGEGGGGSSHNFFKRGGRSTGLNKLKAGTGEVMVQNNVPLDDIRAIVCQTAKQRTDAITEFKSLGVHTIGGRPVEDVVVTSHAEAGTLVKASWAATTLARNP